MNKIAVIGAGISGISVASMLQEKGYTVSVFEKAEKIGGLIKCDLIDGNLYHRVGGHVFNAKQQEVSDWFWKHFDQDTEFIKAKRNAKIWFNGKYIGYPIENYLYQLDKSDVSAIISDVLELQSNGYKDPFTYPNFEAFLIGNFGKHLYEMYFKPYNSKIWNTDLSKVALPWLEGKLPMPNYLDLILSNIIKLEESTMIHSSFYYPVSGGSQFIAERLADKLVLNCSQATESIEIVDSGLKVNGADNYNSLVYTGDVRNLAGIIQTEDRELISLLNTVSDLSSNGTSNVLCETDDTDVSWLYIPQTGVDAHRIIYTGNFSENNNKLGGRMTCTVEFSGKKTIDEIQTQLPKLPGNLKLLAYNYEPNSYVIQHDDTRSLILALKKKLKTFNIHLTGRFAEWEYYNMDKAIEASMNLVNDSF